MPTRRPQNNYIQLLKGFTYEGVLFVELGVVEVFYQFVEFSRRQAAHL